MSDLRQNKHKKFRRRRIILFSIMIPIMLIIMVVSVYATYLYSKGENAFDKAFSSIRDGKGSDLRTKNVVAAKDNMSFLIIGVDDSDVRNFKGNARSDALLYGTLNIKTHALTLLSIPRDSYVLVPGTENSTEQWTKIAHAHAYGGPELSVKTVENTLQLPVDKYVRFNFTSFLEIVDALGGIEVDVPVSFTEQDSKDKAGAITLKKGLQELNGEQALALARTRHIDNDIERGKRQQLVIEAIIKKALQMGSISKYGSIIDTVGNNMKTDMDFETMMSLAKYAINNKDDFKVKSINLKGADSTIDNIYYYQLDNEELHKTANTLAKELDFDLPFPDATNTTGNEVTTDTGIGTETETPAVTP